MAVFPLSVNGLPLIGSITLFALLLLSGVLLFRKFGQERNAGNDDHSARLLVVLMITAALSITSFIAFIFLHKNIR